jgi:hypothetical protein
MNIHREEIFAGKNKFAKKEIAKHRKQSFFYRCNEMAKDLFCSYFVNILPK